MKKLSILGCGYLGYALAKSLENKYDIQVSVSSHPKRILLEKEGFTVFIINDNTHEEKFFNCDFLFIAIPPSKSKDYLALLKRIYESILKTTRVIFISSTSIYPNEKGIFDENSRISSSVNSMVFKAEELVKKRTDIIFRCAGLMGYNRISGKYFASKVLDCENQRVNYVHRDDVIKATEFVIDNDIKGIYNLCSQEHPTKKELYLFNAKKYGFQEAIFKDKKIYFKREINAVKLIKKGFKYLYSNPKNFI